MKKMTETLFFMYLLNLNPLSYFCSKQNAQICP